MSNDRIPEIENDQMTLTIWPNGESAYVRQLMQASLRSLNRRLDQMTKVSWQNHDNEVVNLSVDKGEVHLGKDVATALGYAKSRNALTAHVDDEDKKDALIQGPLVTEGQAPCDLIGEWP